MPFLVYPLNYGATITIYPTRIGYYIVKFISTTVALQYDNTTNGKVFRAV